MTDIVEQYFRKVGHTLSLVLYYQLSDDRQEYFRGEMQRVMDGERDPVTDQEMFPAMDIGNPEILY